MSKQMTPCEMLGYKVGDEFEVISHHAFKKGQVVTLHEDDGTECPLFSGDGGGAGVFDGVECSFATLNEQVRKIANKLKPAKQALADAIHQNGGWIEQANYAVQSGGNLRIHFTDDDKKPVRCAGGGWKCQYGFMFLGSTIPLKSKLKNWHQCILSRDEYFTAYPEQVKVYVKNETKHKVGVEMESESEVTIKVSDWHKNGELPPVGEICEIHHSCWNESKFEKVKIAAITKDYLIVEYATFEQHYLRKDMSFRSLRTERDKAIDEMMLECQYAGDSVDKCKKFAIALYDAGYRKEVE